MAKLFHKILATGFGSGLSPLAPGTAGTLVALLILWALSRFAPELFSGSLSNMPYLLLLIAGFTGIGIWVINKLEPEWGHDAQRIVLDEIVGFWVSMLAVPVSMITLALAFLLFRIFDIWKPLGIRKMEALPGAWGVMMDDVLAGVYACLVLHIARLAF